MIKDLNTIIDLGYKRDNNYYYLTNDSTIGYKARIVLPYGLLDGYDNFYISYTQCMMGIMDNFFEFPNKLNCVVTATNIVIAIEVYTLKDLNIALGTLFNFMSNIDVEKLFEKENDKTIFSSFKNVCNNVFDNVDEVWLRNKDVICTDVIERERHAINTLSDEELIKYFKNVKEKIQEKNCIVFLEGKGVDKLAFSKDKSILDKFKRPDGITLNPFNKYTLSYNGYWFYRKYTPDTNGLISYHLDMFCLYFIKGYFGFPIACDEEKDSLFVYLGSTNDEELVNNGLPGVMSDDWIEYITSNSELLISNFVWCKGIYLQDYTNHYNKVRTNIDYVVNTLIKNTRFESIETADTVINTISKLNWNGFREYLNTFLKEVQSNTELAHLDKLIKENI